jgi:CBS domain-containing protein
MGTQRRTVGAPRLRRQEQVMTTAADVMNPHPITIDAEDTAVGAAQKMAEHHIGMLPVVRDGGVIAVVTDRDLVLRVLARGRDAATTRLSEVATGWVVTVAPDTPLDQIERLIEERRVRRLPVVSVGKLVGIVSQSDVARNSPDASPHLLEPPQVWLE